MEKLSKHTIRILFVAVLVLPIVIFIVGLTYVNMTAICVGAMLFLVAYYICFGTVAKNVYCQAKKDLCLQIEKENKKSEEIDETWKLEEIAPRIFLLTFGNPYDLGMRFLRFQEYYESPCPDFKGTVFTLLDYMDWYSKAHDLSFTYPTDWGGYNVPGWVFREVFEKGKIEDWNQYDEFMLSIVESIRIKLPPDEQDQFYLIGVDKYGDAETVDHELAHGFYYVFPEYKREMDECLASLGKNSKQLKLMYECLEDQGYDSSVFDDEAQAYFATGVQTEYANSCKKHNLILKQTTKSFEEVFAKWKAKYRKS